MAGAWRPVTVMGGADLQALRCGSKKVDKYLLHEFVVMPDHFHVLLTPQKTLERAMQLIKGGFSFRAKKEMGFSGEIWETSFYDHRVRDAVQ